MRPINLIPDDERRSHGSVTRTGPLAYVIVGSLAVLLIGVVMLVLTANSISDKEDEVTSLEAQKTAAVARVEKLAPYTNFHSLAEQRTQTIASLADSRFDWPRVIRQLALIIPPRVYLTGLTTSAGGGAGEAEGISVSGPSMQLTGCAPHQWVVAGFVASLKDIDGVTRVALENSALTESDGSLEGTVCEASTVYDFQLVVAFDGAPASVDGPEAVAAATAEAAEAAAEGTEESGEAAEGKTEGGEEAPAPEGEESATSSTATEATG